MFTKKTVRRVPWEDDIFVGQKRDEYKTGAEGSQIDIGENGLVLTIMLPNISNKELHSYLNGLFELRIVLINNAIWFTFQFGNMGWEEAPFAIQLAKIPNKRDYRKYCERLIILVVDTASGQVMSLSAVPLSEQNKDMLFQYVDESMNVDFNEAEYRDFLSEVQSQYTVREIAKRSYFLLSSK